MKPVKHDPAIAAAAIAVLCIASPLLLLPVAGAGEEEPTTELSNGFTAAHAADAAAPFEPVLYAPSGAFALGFLRAGTASLDLAVVHLPSSFPVWRATTTTPSAARLGNWSRPATLTFDGNLVLTDPDGGVLWQTPVNTSGDLVVLLNSSNLVVRRYEAAAPEWESFEHPSDTLVVGQNFTADSPPLVSANRRFSLRLGKTFMALHMEFDSSFSGDGGGRTAAPMYWRHTALMAQPENATEPPVYGRLDARGFFGLYINDDDGNGGGGGGGGSERRVDVLSFDTFAQNLTGAGGVFRRMTLDDDGNLRAYYWAAAATTGGDGGGTAAAAWTEDYRAIAERCELPAPCGSYGLCVPGGNDECQCLLDNSTSAAAAAAAPACGRAEEETAGDLCGGGGDGQQKQEVDGFEVVRRKRVTVAYKELLPAASANATAEECEAACAGNCSCWAAVHSGGGGGGGWGYCYLIDFPVETMVYEADDRKVGYFKVRRKKAEAAATLRRRRGMSAGVAAATAVLALVLVGLATAGACVVREQVWEGRRKRRGGAGMEQELVPAAAAGPYKDLKSMASSSSSSSSSNSFGA